jgi:hypothetical protein
MWQRLSDQLNNLRLNLAVYSDMSPDLGVRQRINTMLGNRPDRSLGEWYRHFWEPQGIAREVAEFVYQQVGQYSGLKFERVMPKDRLREDLELPMVCWFDWELCLCDDFCQQMGIELEECFDMNEMNTVEDLMRFFNQKFKQLRMAGS